MVLLVSSGLPRSQTDALMSLPRPTPTRASSRPPCPRSPAPCPEDPGTLCAMASCSLCCRGGWSSGWRPWAPGIPGGCGRRRFCLKLGSNRRRKTLQLMKSCSCRSCLTSLCPAGASGALRRRSSFPPQEKVRRVQQERRGRSQTGDPDRWVPRPHRYVRPCAEASGRKRSSNPRCPLKSGL